MQQSSSRRSARNTSSKYENEVQQKNGQQQKSVTGGTRVGTRMKERMRTRMKLSTEEHTMRLMMDHTKLNPPPLKFTLAWLGQGLLLKRLFPPLYQCYPSVPHQRSATLKWLTKGLLPCKEDTL